MAGLIKLKFVRAETILQSTVTKLIVYIAFIFYLGGCAEGGGSGTSGNSNSGLNVERTGDGVALVSWMPPTANTDNSALTDLAGFKIYYGENPGDYDRTIIIDNPGLTSYLVENLASSDWYFVMTAFNISGIESSYSAEVFKGID
jgi:hypothetical protein